MTKNDYVKNLEQILVFKEEVAKAKEVKMLENEVNKEIRA